MSLSVTQSDNSIPFISAARLINPLRVTDTLTWNYRTINERVSIKACFNSLNINLFHLFLINLHAFGRASQLMLFPSEHFTANTFQNLIIDIQQVIFVNIGIVKRSSKIFQKLVPQDWKKENMTPGKMTPGKTKKFLRPPCFFRN